MTDELEDRYDEAVGLVRGRGEDVVSISFMQRRMRIGFAAACWLAEKMTERGVCTAPSSGKPRTLIPAKAEVPAPVKDGLNQALELKVREWLDGGAKVVAIASGHATSGIADLLNEMNDMVAPVVVVLERKPR